MSACDMMRVDGVRGQARVTFTGALTAVPTGCCQAPAHPRWPLSTPLPLPTPVSAGCHTFSRVKDPQKILPSWRHRAASEAGKWRKTAVEGWIRTRRHHEVVDCGEGELYFMLNVTEPPGHLPLHLGSSLIRCKWLRNCQKWQKLHVVSLNNLEYVSQALQGHAPALRPRFMAAECLIKELSDSDWVNWLRINIQARPEWLPTASQPASAALQPWRWSRSLMWFLTSWVQTTTTGASSQNIVCSSSLFFLKNAACYMKTISGLEK